MKKRLSVSLILSILLMLTMFMNAAAAAETGKSISTDFSGSLSSDWRYISELPINIDDGQLHAKGINFTAIQPKDGVYDDFAVTFDIISMTASSGWVGVAFGMKTADSNFYDSGSHLVTFKDDIVLWGAPKLEFTTIESDNEFRWINPEEAVPANLKEPLNVRVVYQDGVLSVYYKLQSQPASEFDTPKTTYADIKDDITGYMKITTSGDPDFVIDNLTVYADPSKVGSQVDASKGEQPAQQPAEQPAEQAASNNGDTSSNPETGDNGMTPYIAMVLAGGAAAFLLARKIRKN